MKCFHYFVFPAFRPPELQQIINPFNTYQSMGPITQLYELLTEDQQLTDRIEKSESLTYKLALLRRQRRGLSRIREIIEAEKEKAGIAEKNLGESERQ